METEENKDAVGEEKSNIIPFPPRFKAVKIERPEMHYYRYHVKGMIPIGEDEVISFDNNFFLNAPDEKSGATIVAKLHNGIDKWLLVEVEKLR